MSERIIFSNSMQLNTYEYDVNKIWLFLKEEKEMIYNTLLFSKRIQKFEFTQSDSALAIFRDVQGKFCAKPILYNLMLWKYFVIVIKCSFLFKFHFFFRYRLRKDLVRYLILHKISQVLIIFNVPFIFSSSIPSTRSLLWSPTLLIF